MWGLLPVVLPGMAGPKLVNERQIKRGEQI
jgi:hypothetical protein